MLSVDLNCDLGEGYPADAALMPLITSANTNATSLMIGEKGASLILETT